MTFRFGDYSCDLHIRHNVHSKMNNGSTMIFCEVKKGCVHKDNTEIMKDKNVSNVRHE